MNWKFRGYGVNLHSDLRVVKSRKPLFWNTSFESYSEICYFGWPNDSAERRKPYMYYYILIPKPITMHGGQCNRYFAKTICRGAITG